MRTSDVAPTVETKATQTAKSPEPEAKQELRPQQDSSAARLITRLGTPPSSGIEPARRSGAGRQENSATVHQVLQLQRRYGNRYVQKLLHSQEQASFRNE